VFLICTLLDRCTPSDLVSCSSLLVHVSVQSQCKPPKTFNLYISPTLWSWEPASSTASGQSLKPGPVICPVPYQVGSLLAASSLSCVCTHPTPPGEQMELLLQQENSHGSSPLLNSVFMTMKWQWKKHLRQCWNNTHTRVVRQHLKFSLMSQEF